MRTLLIILIIIIFISCDKKHPFSNYEGVYILNKNPLDTLIIKNIRRDSYYISYYEGEYERRIIINGLLIIIKDELMYDSVMDNLYFYNIDTFEKESNSIFGYFKGFDMEKNKKFSTTRFSTNIFGKKFIECDIDHIYDYKKID